MGYQDRSRNNALSPFIHIVSLVYALNTMPVYIFDNKALLNI